MSRDLSGDKGTQPPGDRTIWPEGTASAKTLRWEWAFAHPGDSKELNVAAAEHKSGKRCKMSG